MLGCLLSHAPALRGWLADHIAADAVIFGDSTTLPDPMWATALRFEPRRGLKRVCTLARKLFQGSENRCLEMGPSADGLLDVHHFGLRQIVLGED